MSQQWQYMLDVGTGDQNRLEILGKLYQPFSLNFLRKNGLKKGIHVLEIGCGVGDMACALASEVGEDGFVTAIDTSPEQLHISREKAIKGKLFNLEFLELSASDIPQLNAQFDFIFQKWVLIFLKNPRNVLQLMYDSLKPGGVLACEDCSPGNTGIFSFPYSPVVQFFESLMHKNFEFNLNFGESLYKIFNDMGLNSIDVALHQPILRTPEDKSVFRLGFLTSRKSTIESGNFSSKVIDKKIQEAEIFEEENHLIGFIRNVLICGRKKF